MIKEVIVVEGKDDISAVKKAVDADLISTSGFGLNEKIIEKIKNAAEKRGIIVLTDPDYAGETIRRRVQELVPDCKHAYIPRREATKNGDIGVENASPESIIEALSKVKTEIKATVIEFTMEDLMKDGLIYASNASNTRDMVGAELGIGYGNAKQFLSRLNRYGIKRDEYKAAVAKIKEI